jgi:hypothetical protein
MSNLKIKASSVINLTTPDINLTVKWEDGVDVIHVASRLVALLSVDMDQGEFDDMLLRWGKNKREYEVDKAMGHTKRSGDNTGDNPDG